MKMHYECGAFLLWLLNIHKGSLAKKIDVCGELQLRGLQIGSGFKISVGQTSRQGAGTL